MKMPGYTAEASLGRAGVHWHSAAADHMIVVQPQLRKTDYECVHDCLEAGGPTDICNFFCTESGDEGGGGGGGGQQCRPGCGPCKRDPDSRTGRSRTCVTVDCDTYTRRC